MFVMDANGTLTTDAQFDYESYQSLSIRVAAMDELNASVEGAFTVFITDQNETAPNQAPVGLYNVGSLEVAENEPIGTFVEFFCPGSGRRFSELPSGKRNGRRKQQPVFNGCEWDPDHRCSV